MTTTTWTADELVSRYDEVRSHTERLAAPLSPEDQTVQSMPDVSPTKWHRAHVTWFFETFVLADHERSFAPFQDKYWFLFNSYYEAVGPRYAQGAARRDQPTRRARRRASTASNVDTRMRDLVSTLDEGTLDKLASTIELGFHHEQQHQELLLMDIKHVLSLNPLLPSYAGTPSPVAESDQLGWVDVEGGLVEIGHRGAGFSFDNELPLHQVHLEPYRLADRLVTNAEWLAFMADGGYRRPELWLSDGWARVRAEGWEAPFYWTEVDGVWFEHTLHGTWPVEPRPAGLARQPLRGRRVRRLGRQAAPDRGRVGARRALCAPRRRRQPRRHRDVPSAAGRPVDGQRCARRTATVGSGPPRPTCPTRASTPRPGAIGEYNGKFMSNQMVLRGGCAITSPGHTRASYRNFFPPGARWALSGVRLADGGAPRSAA